MVKKLEKSKAKSLKYDLDCIAHQHAASYSWKTFKGILFAIIPLGLAYFSPVKYQDMLFFSCIPLSIAIFIYFRNRAGKFSEKCPVCGEPLKLNGPKWNLISVSVECGKCRIKSDEEYPLGGDTV